MNARQLGIFELVLVISIAFLPSLIKSLIFSFTGKMSDYSRLNYTDYVVWIAQGILSITLLFYVLFKNNRNYSEIGLKLKFEWKDILIGIGLMIVAGFANAILAGLVKIISPDFVKNATNPQNIGFLKTNLFGLLFVIMIIVPIQEELIVRGYTMSEIFKLTDSKTIAIIVSVSLQFTYHLYQGIAPAIFMLPYFIIISIYFVRTGNLNPVIYSHILIDLLNLIWRK